jgi:hypothetical protein
MKEQSIQDVTKKKSAGKGSKTKKASSEKLTINDVRAIAEKMGVHAGKLNKTELIRAIQRAEGNKDCFATVQVQNCGQTNCLWHQDCAMC